MRRSRRLAFTAAISLAFVLLLLGVEGLVRLTLPAVDPLDVFVRSATDQANLVDREAVRVFAFDPLLYWKLKPDLVDVIWDFTRISTDHQGLRYPRPVGRPPGDGLRIVALGDSVTFGYRVPVVWPEHPDRWDPAEIPWPRLLEQHLAAANPERPIEVVPLAVPGYTSHQGLAWLRRDIDRLKPDLVIACFGWNDITLRARPDHLALAAAGARRRALVSHSQLLLRLVRALGRRRSATAAPAPTVLRVSRRRYVANLRAIVRLAAAHGAPTLVVAPVLRDSEELPEAASRLASHRMALRLAMASDATPYLEVPELTESAWPANRGLFGESIHPNGRGHRLLARAIAAALAEHALLPGWHVPPLPNSTATTARTDRYEYDE